MQAKVPQNVQMADRIVGPLTLKHMIILGAGGGLAYLIYVILSRTYFWEIWLPPVAIIVIITVASAFLKIYNLSFGRFLISLIEHYMIPRKRKWSKSSAEVLMMGQTVKKPTKEQKQAKERGKEAAKTMGKLKDISKVLDTYSEKIEKSNKK